MVPGQAGAILAIGSVACLPGRKSWRRSLLPSGHLWPHLAPNHNYRHTLRLKPNIQASRMSRFDTLLPDHGHEARLPMATKIVSMLDRSGNFLAGNRIIGARQLQAQCLETRIPTGNSCPKSVDAHGARSFRFLRTSRAAPALRERRVRKRTASHACIMVNRS